MKKIALFTVIVLAVAISANVQAQKPFKKGIVTYTISYDGTWDAATLAQQPTEQRVMLLGKQSKTEIITPGATITTITNGLDSSSTILLDVPSVGWRYYMKTPKDKILESQADKTKPVINYLEETKVIAGYTCNKAEYITED